MLESRRTRHEESAGLSTTRTGQADPENETLLAEPTAELKEQPRNPTPHAPQNEKSPPPS
ncbi:hypothetical protein [Actinomadura sp. BRA 177]|uniref:hypothetical protein n=1 Tax=Actinomadura sp. BRA 177 TaxID=2745202 RepID=UPI0015954D15|nr:hypothetical protein [Actinomadura sp. BRA 177]NVI91012.1 hypothetical protein [Actinomadura sp. BRA 177]